MKLEFIKDTAILGHFSDEVNDQLIRLYDFDAAEAEKFCDSIQHVIINNNQILDLTSLDFIEAVNCNLVLQLFETNEGINTGDNINFTCDLTIAGYLNIIKLCTPFCQNKSRGFAWMYDIDTPIDFLFSPHGTW